MKNILPVLYIIAATSALATFVIFTGAKSVMHEIAALLFATQTTIILCTCAVIDAIKEAKS